MSTPTLNIIKESFEHWYNQTFSKTPVSIVINYSDTQTLSIKAYHSIKMEVSEVCIQDNQPAITPLLELHEYYNHGVTSEQEAKDGLTRKLLTRLYAFGRH